MEVGSLANILFASKERHKSLYTQWIYTKEIIHTKIRLKYFGYFGEKV
jgi:hypothetical protein